MPNFHFELSLRLPQGEVHDFSGECKNSQGRCKTISGEVRTSPHTSPQNPAMLITKCYEIFITAHPSAIEHTAIPEVWTRALSVFLDTKQFRFPPHNNTGSLCGFY